MAPKKGFGSPRKPTRPKPNKSIWKALTQATGLERPGALAPDEGKPARVKGPCPEYGNGKHQFNPVGRSTVEERTWGGKTQLFRVQPTQCKCSAKAEELHKHTGRRP
jgi:hypothetical protein